MKKVPTLDRRILEFYADTWKNMGADLRRISEDAGYVYPLLSDSQRIPVEIVSRCLDLIELDLQDPEFMFRVEQYIPLEFKSPISIPAFTNLLENSPDLFNLIQNLTRYLSLATDTISISLHEHGEIVEVKFTPNKYVYVSPHHIEGAMIIFKIALDRAQLVENGLRSVHFSHDPRFATSRYEEYFGSEVCFGSQDCALILPRELLESRLPGYQEDRWHYYKACVKQNMENIDEAKFIELTGYIKDVVKFHLPTGVPSPATISNDLGIGVRTLQRILKAGGRTLRELVEEVRREVAIELIGNDGLPIHEVAYILGYSDSSTFSRAFKAWTGSAPSSFEMSD